LAFKEGMWDTQISALWGWPTVSGEFLRHFFLPSLRGLGC
jgi:hypothetical protein